MLDAPEDPFGGTLRVDQNAGPLVEADGVIGDRGPYARVRGRHPSAEVCELVAGLTSGLVVSDRRLRPDLLTTAQRA